MLRADLLRREAYALLSEPAPEVRALRLLRADALWRLREKKQAESEFAASVAGATDEVAALIERASVFQGLGLNERADADLALATAHKPDDPRPWVMKGRLLAARGQGSAADEAYVRAAALAPGRLDPFLEAGWWVVGPYVDDMSRPQPPEVDPDPSRPTLGESGAPARWKPAAVNQDRFVQLGAYAGRPASSVYALTYIATDHERTALLCLNGGVQLRVWMNGRLVFDSSQSNSYRPGPEFLVPVALFAGRNTLLVRVSHKSGDHRLRLRSDDFELDRAYLTAEFGRWRDAADLMDRARARGQLFHPWPMVRRVRATQQLVPTRRPDSSMPRPIWLTSTARRDPSLTIWQSRSAFCRTTSSAPIA